MSTSQDLRDEKAKRLESSLLYAAIRHGELAHQLWCARDMRKNREPECHPCKDEGRRLELAARIEVVGEHIRGLAMDLEKRAIAKRWSDQK